MADEYVDGVGNKYVLQTAIGAYAQEAYTDARRITNSGIVSSNPTIDANEETFTGQLRWMKPITPVINIASLVDPTDGVPTNFSSAFLTYIKTIRTSGAVKINLADAVTKEDGLKQYGDQVANIRLIDENNAVLSILKGIALSEVMRGTGTVNGQVGLGGQTFDTDPTNARVGMYVDLGSAPIVSSNGSGASRVQELIEALGMAWKDYEPEYAYFFADPLMVAGLRSANLIDGDRVTDGSIEFESILDGKLRLVKSRSNLSFSNAERTAINTGAGIDLVGTRTSFVVLPGAIAFESVNISKPVGIDSDESAYHGGGTTEMWNRWGYVAHPVGYDWAGPKTKFPSDMDYQSVEVTDDVLVPITHGSVTDADNARTVWQRKTSSALGLGILPIFHG